MAKKALTPLTVPDDAYDATTWNGSTEVPTKNAVRDKIETMTGTGDVVGPAGATDSALAVYNGATGKLLKDSSVIFAGARWLDTNSGLLKATGRSGVSVGVSDGLGSSTTYLSVATGGVDLLQLKGTSSGTTQLNAAAAAGSTLLTLPAATDTLIGKATTDILTNKTFDTAGAGNVFKIAGVAVSSVTGSGAVNVLATSPTLVTPILGVAAATTVNKVTMTAPATGATLTLVDGGTLATAGAFSQTHTVTATTNATYPAGTITLQDLSTAQTITGVKTFGAAGNVGKLVIAGTTSGSTVLNATAVASGTLTLPAATDTLVGKATTDVLTNKDMTSATNLFPTTLVKTVKVQKFTASGTYTPSTSMIYCIIECVGGGGAGGGSIGATSNTITSPGGGSGGYSRSIKTAANIGASQTVTIGTGGTAASGALGGNGADTSVGVLVIGKGGTGGSVSGVTQTGGAGGVAGTGDVTITGNAGQPGGIQGGSVLYVSSGGAGGVGYFGGGVTCPMTNGNQAGVAGTSGSGGSGSSVYNLAANNAGGAGGAGIVVVTEFCGA